ncbi:hypothetical protein JCM10212_003511 [Sporobolomyces blumeae]
MPASVRSFRGAQRPPPSAYRSPPSPTLSATTNVSQLDLGDEGPPVIVTRADLRDSVTAYEQLLAAAKSYRNALIAVSAASTDLAGALGQCSRVKGAGESAEHLLAASGLHYMVANSGQVLSDTLYRSFEVPLMTAYDTYVAEIATRHADYEALLYEKTAKIRETEAENLKLGKKKARDLNQFRQALAKLTEQVAEVDVCKRSYYSEVLESETEMWNQIDHKVSLLIRSTLDLSDRLASKATSDPVIESMLDEHPDPFDSYRLESEETRDVFTVLPPMNLGLASSVGSKKSETEREASRSKVAEASTSTGANGDDSTAEDGKRATTVTDVLGLGETRPADGGETSKSRGRRPGRHDTSDEEDARQRDLDDPETRSLRQATQDLTVAAVASISASPSPADSPALRPDTRESLFDEPSLTDESAPFVTRPESSRSSTATSGRQVHVHGRRLSKVPEAEPVETDPMSGDWGNPVYERSLGPALNGGTGYESGEEDNGWRG